jgi:hypothetical protein
MGTKIPANLITTGYTSGKEFVYVSNYKPYQGYYYEINNKFFVGKEFDNNAPEIIKLTSSKINPLLLKAATSLFGQLSGIILSNIKIPSFFYNYQGDIRYFLAENNSSPLLIKEIDKTSFDQIQSNSLYTSVALTYKGGFSENELKDAEKKIPGITIFVNSSYTSPSVEEDGTIG